MSTLADQSTHDYHLQLTGVNCNGCVNKIRNALLEQDQAVQVDIQLPRQRATIVSFLPQPILVSTITALGFTASAIEPRESRFKVTGVRCNGCVNKIRKQLQQLDSAAEVDADLEQSTLHFNSRLEPDQLQALLQQLDYGCEPLLESESVAQPALADSPVEEGESRRDSASQDVPSAAAGASIHLAISGMTCAGCVKSVEDALDSVAGVAQAKVNFASRNAQVYLQANTDVDQIAGLVLAAVDGAGYGASQVEDAEQAEQLREQNEQGEYRRRIDNTWLGLGLGIPLMLYGLFFHMSVTSSAERLGWGLVGILTGVLLMTAGRHFFVGAWKAFRNHNANMDTLIALGTGSAWLYSMVVVFATQWLPVEARGLYFEAAAMIIGLINLGQALEIKARGRTSQAIKRLLNLKVKTARVLRDGQELDLPVEQVELDDQIRVRPGEQFAVDGVVVDGESSVDEAMLTGEPMPVVKTAGDQVSTGTINRSGSLVYRATRIGQDTVLAKIIEMVRQAQNSKPAISHLADRVASVFVPSVMIIAVVTALAWFNLGPEPQITYMLVSACTVLIIACPCALGLATPISVMIAIGKAAEAGILIRNGEALQRASELDVVVLDKTGTITEGQPSVSEFRNLSTLSDGYLLALIHTLESQSEHPLAEAICRYGIDCVDSKQKLLLTQFSALSGLGVSAQLDGKQLLLGNARLMQQHQVDTEIAQNLAAEWHAKACTVVYLAIDGELVALLAISDQIKSDAVAAIKRLREHGLKVVMLTGDNSATAQAVARTTAVDEYRAELMPDDKLAFIRQLQDEGKRVAMVGDGINDAPSLSQADIGFAIGSGTDVAIESADVTLMRGSLHSVADSIELSRACMRNIRQNLWGAFGYNSLGIPIAAGVLYPFIGVLLNPVIAGVAMSLSSLTVVSNANRLRLLKLGKGEGSA
ncbi:MAG: copper-translocating P-type ATPase [Motiliproteus sp.]|nr:copper-translocating P-type ATPase [Motiliproteus sp.]MCW9051879.1 copper-translocating P-type ATPase [Motiliproteus sp.]